MCTLGCDWNRVLHAQGVVRRLAARRGVLDSACHRDDDEHTHVAVV